RPPARDGDRARGPPPLHLVPLCAAGGACRAHHGPEGDPVVVWQADTRRMNPTVAARTTAPAHEDGAAPAAAEYGAEFRRDIESFVAREAVEACVIPERFELPYLSTFSYTAFTDPAGGSGGDSMTLAITDGRRGTGAGSACSTSSARCARPSAPSRSSPTSRRS